MGREQLAEAFQNGKWKELPLYCFPLLGFIGDIITTTTEIIHINILWFYRALNLFIKLSNAWVEKD